MTGSTPAPRVVLDTNVCLDLLLFGDPRAEALRHALLSGDVIAIGNDECRDEWLRVLRYPALGLDDACCTALVAVHDALLRPFNATDPLTGTQPDVTLPRCSDPDDQKFLQLAHDVGARWLISRDNHLLSLARRCRRDGLFEILTPEQWALRSTPPACDSSPL